MENEETDEGGQTSVEPEGDSAPFRAALARAEAAEAQLKEIAEKEVIAETEAQQLRSDAVDAIVKLRGIPELAADLLRWVEGPITEESVEAALQAKGLNFVPGELPAPVELPPLAPPVQPTIIPASKLGQQVADAASGAEGKTLDQKIADATNPADVAAVAEEAGFSVSYT